MKSYTFTKEGDGIRLEGFPNAVKFIKIDGDKALRAAHLILHRNDLALALGCLEGINKVPEDAHAIRDGLWSAAIVHFRKCFGRSEARSRLDFATVYNGHPDAKRAFDYFTHLRNRHIVHDENPFSQCYAGAVLNPRDASSKIEEVVCSHIKSETLNQQNCGNLHLLITHAIKWVAQEFDLLCIMLKTDLEALPYDELLRREPVSFRAPAVEDVGKRRSK